MPQKAWAVSEEVLAADFNNYVQNQTVPAFASTTERDAQWPSPPNGAMCVVTTGATTLYLRIAGVWYPQYPGGKITTATRTTDAGPQGPEAVFLSTGTIAPAANRSLRIEAFARSIDSSVANGVSALRIREGTTTAGTLRCEAVVAANAVNSGSSVYMAVEVSSTATQYSLTLTGLSGNSTLRAATSYPCFLRISDAG